jgi:hypothetical protein
VLDKIKNIFRRDSVSPDNQLKDYRKVVELAKKLLHEDYVPICGDEECIAKHIKKYYDKPKEFVRIVLPPPPGEVVYFAKKNDSLREALKKNYIDDIVYIEVYRNPYGCDIKMYRVEDPVQRIKFIEGLAKYIEDDVMGKGLEEEIR